MSEIKRVRAEPGQLEATLRSAMSGGEGALNRVQIGEGADAVIVADAHPQRRCGQCTFCCTAAGVNELEKPPMMRCRHLVRGGCGIHQRPDQGFPNSCAKFSCGWLLGNFDERFRPDKIGAYVSFFLTDDFGFYAVVQCVSAKLHQKRLRQLLRRLAVYIPEIRVVYDDKRGVLLRQGEPARRFVMLARPPGDFEGLIYQFIE